jgi:hypothetical protein
MTSPNGTIVTPNTGGAITDSNGNIWTISSSGMVVENGVADTFTANVTELAFKNGVLWQENTSFLWYAKEGNVPGSYHGWSPGTYTAPVPVTRTWVGGGNNSAGNANDWNDHGAPQAGDTLNMTNGAVINVTGNQLHGDPLTFPISAEDASATINVSGVTTMQVDAFYGDDVTINLAANSEWVGGFSAYPGDVFNIHGSGVWDNNGVTTTSTTTNIGVNVIGVGTIDAHQAHSQGVLTFLHGVSVGSSQTVDVNGYELYGGQFGNVEVQSPSLYHAFTTIGFGQVELDGLHGTSYTFASDLLSIFNGKTVVDTLRLAVNNSQNAMPVTLVVAQTATGIGIYTDGHAAMDHATALPVHV